MKRTLNTKVILALSAALAGSSALAQEEQPIADEPTFRQIFKQSVGEAASLASMRKRESLTAEFSATIATPTNVVLTNKYFEVPYTDSVSTLPGFQLGFSFGLVSNSRLSLGGLFQTGYSYAQVVGPAKSLKTGYSSVDSLRLQRAPLMLGLRGAYDTGPVTLFAEPTIGVQWLSQSGYLDGVSQNFWVPTMAATVGIVLFDQSGHSNSWFGGVKLAAGIERSLGSDQKFEARHYEVGLRAGL